jgi:hypothetical protein
MLGQARAGSSLQPDSTSCLAADRVGAKPAGILIRDLDALTARHAVADDGAPFRRERVGT